MSLLPDIVLTTIRAPTPSAITPTTIQMSEITRNLTNNTVVPVLMATTYNTAHSVKSHVDSRSSGGGGHSSFGGGGGFSGGGSGGGVR